MSLESLTDEKIKELLSMQKIVNNPTARNSDKEGRRQKTYILTAEDENEFQIYLRQNLNEGMEDDFSCGLSWHPKGGDAVTLVRYNGGSHDHPNHLEKTRTGLKCHIHKATEKYIKANKKPEGYAESTDRYTTLEGALYALVTDCNVIGLTANPEAPTLGLFDNQ